MNKALDEETNERKDSPNLTHISGIGPTLSARLRKAGYYSLENLSTSDPTKIAEEVKGISVEKAEEITITATKLVEKTRKSKKVDDTDEDANFEIDDLVRELRSEDQQVALGAIDRLGKIGDKRATKQLMNCLDDPRYMIRMFAAVQLGERKDERVVDALIEALHDDSLFVRQTAAGALENIGFKRGLDAIEDAEEEGLLLNELPEGKMLTD